MKFRQNRQFRQIRQLLVALLGGLFYSHNILLTNLAKFRQSRSFVQISRIIMSTTLPKFRQSRQFCRIRRLLRGPFIQVIYSIRSYHLATNFVTSPLLPNSSTFWVPSWGILLTCMICQQPWRKTSTFWVPSNS